MMKQISREEVRAELDCYGKDGDDFIKWLDSQSWEVDGVISGLQYDACKLWFDSHIIEVKKLEDGRVTILLLMDMKEYKQLNATIL